MRRLLGVAFRVAAFLLSTAASTWALGLASAMVCAYIAGRDAVRHVLALLYDTTKETA